MRAGQVYAMIHEKYSFYDSDSHHDEFWGPTCKLFGIGKSSDYSEIHYFQFNIWDGNQQDALTFSISAKTIV